MQPADGVRFAWLAVRGAPLRSSLMMTAMAIGVAAVVVLTALGDGARNYVLNEFASLGTNLVIVLPGRSETGGAGFAMSVSGTPRDLTLDDARALAQHGQVRHIAPLTVGTTLLSANGLERDVPVLGATHDLLTVRNWSMSQGKFLPAGDPDHMPPVCVIGSNVRQELFGGQPALGAWVRLGDRRFRVIGILASEGRSIGVDTQDLVVIPVAAAQQLFNTPSLFRILIEARNRESIPRVKAFIEKTITARHQGENDITVITQDAVLATFDRILRALTLTVAGIAAISLAVAGILVMNVMLVAVSQRIHEIGLLKAIGATRRQILTLFLLEAALLSLFGAALGLLIGYLGSALLISLYPALPAHPPLWAILAGLGIALGTGLVFGVLPARKSARMNPVAALAGQLAAS